MLQNGAPDEAKNRKVCRCCVAAQAGWQVPCIQATVRPMRTPLNVSHRLSIPIYVYKYTKAATYGIAPRKLCAIWQSSRYYPQSRFLNVMHNIYVVGNNRY